MLVSSDQFQQVIDSVDHNLTNSHAIGFIVGVILITFAITRLISWIGAQLLKVIINYTERSQSEKLIKFKRAETWLNVVLAIIKLIIVCLAVYICWRVIFPASSSAAVVGASAVFIVLASATVGPLLRDITAGSIMAAERWYGVGDFVTIEPFLNAQGVVEQMSLRSTKLRGLSGEVIWVHNQNIQAVKVKYRGATTIALDVFVRDKDKALSLLEGIAGVVPKGPMLVINGLKITDVEELHDRMWRIELSGKTVPGREWLIEKFALESIREADEQAERDQRVIVYGPIARYVDQAAERRFKRSIK